jgi:hypothetical protein
MGTRWVPGETVARFLLMFRLLISFSLLCMSDLTADLSRARALMPIEGVMRRLGIEVPPRHGKLIMSPFRVTDKPHFTVRAMPNGRIKAMDEATGETWDEIDLIEKIKGLPPAEAIQEYLVMAGVKREERSSSRERPAQLPPSPDVPESVTKGPLAQALASIGSALASAKGKPAVEVDFDWDACLAGMTLEKRQELAVWRGWPVEFVDWLVGERLVGLHQGKWAIPVYRGEKCIGAHLRTDDGAWIYTKGAKALPLIWGEGNSMVMAFESQWDAYTALLVLDTHRQAAMRHEVKICVTRGAANAEKLGAYFFEGQSVGFEQNDPPLEPGEALEGNWLWKDKLAKAWPGVEWASPPKQYKDLNDWRRAEGDRMMQSAKEAILCPRSERRSTMSVHSLEEVDAMENDPPGAWLEDEVISQGEPVSILGEGGLGKSRWTLQLIAHLILQKDFCGLKVHQAAYGRRWLILQGENRKRRIKQDIDSLKKNLERSEFDFVKSRIFITTLLKPEDFDLDMTSPERAAEIQQVINDFKPDAVVVDPLGDFTSADMNADEHMKKVADNIITAVRAGNSKRVIVFVHHALTGKDGAAKAVGWDAASFGRGSKALHGKVRSQINLARVDPEDDSRILVACGKNNNGRKFPPIGVVLTEAGLYERDPDFDLEIWKEEMSGTKEKKTAEFRVPIGAIYGVTGRDGISQAALEKRLFEEYGGTKAAMRRIVEEAKKRNELKCFRVGQIYHVKPT